MARLLSAALLLAFAPCVRAQTFGPWRALGRFDFELNKQGIGEVLAPEKAGKGAPSVLEGPDFGASFKGSGGEAVKWRLLGDAFANNTLDCGEFDLNALLPPPASRDGKVEAAAVYLYRRIDCDSEKELAVWTGSDDALKLWLNGAVLVEANLARGLGEQDHFVRLKLRAGPNHLVAKVGNVVGAYKFRIRPWEKIEQSAINEAIDRGCDFLIRRQLLDGSWGVWEEWGAGHTAFTAYTLLKCGVPRAHPAVRKALAFVRENEMDTVYGLSCALLAFTAADDPGDRGLIEDATARLVALQTSTGLYDYPLYPHGGQPPPDMSNTLYAALALRAAVKSDVAVPDAVWAKLAAGVLRCLEPAKEFVDLEGRKRKLAGFGYRMQEGAFGSTTTAGLSVLAICEELGGRTIPAATKTKAAAAKELALAWLARNLAWSVNPHHGEGHHYFWIYGVERVGALYQLERIGEVDWYWDGAAYLLRAQADDGHWNPHGWAHHEYLDTHLALLFLKKATAPRLSGEVTAKPNVLETPELAGQPRLRITGDVQLTMWISALDDALAATYAKDGLIDVERVEYYARAEGEGESERLLGMVKGAPVKRGELQRFAFRHGFERRGKWRVWAKLFLRTPGEAAEAAAQEFETPQLELDVQVAAGSLHLEYAGDRARNVLFDARGKFACSSQFEGESPERVCDGSFELRWRAKPDDEKPWLRITLDRPLKAEKLLLTHALPRGVHSAAARASKVAVVVNQKEHFSLDLDPDVMAKSVLEFGAVLLVKELEVRVLECRDRKLGSDPVGFSELELQRAR